MPTAAPRRSRPAAKPSPVPKPSHAAKPSKAPGPWKAPKAGPARPEARFRLRVVKADVVAIGPGKVELLEAIAATRSISAAARRIGMSYRRAWVLVDEINTALRRPAVASSTGGERGGGSELTDAGRDLVRLYRQIEADAARAAEAPLRQLLALVA